MSGIRGLLDISSRSLNVQGQSIRIIGNNISNVNTTGYTRRRAEIVSEASNDPTESSLGQGVSLEQVTRVVDQFLNSEQRGALGERAKYEIISEMLGRAELPFSVDGSFSTIGQRMSEFFSSLQDLSTSPSNLSLRSNVIEKGQALAQSINQTMETVAGLQREADSRMSVFVSDVNRLVTNIADVNERISNGEYGRQENLSLRDQRDQLLKDLSEYLSFDTLEQADGTVSVFLESGFGLVVGTSAKQIEVTYAPSFAPVGGFPAGFDGLPLGHIVFDYDQTAGTSHIDLTSMISAGSGKLSGLLQVRGVQSTTDTNPFQAVGFIPDIASRVESISRDLLSRFNVAYLGADENGGAAGWQSSAGDLNGNAPAVWGLFSVAGATDTNGNGLPDFTDINGLGLESFSANIIFAETDPERIAAALDLNAAAGATSFADGDARNLDALLALREQQTTFVAGSFSQTGSIEEVYELAVSYTGQLKQSADQNLDFARQREQQVNELQAATSGVSLDEEFAKLIQFQRAFQASARMVKVGDDLLGDILGLIG